MISRVAEHCFWMARYLERAENTARILEVNHTLLLDFHVPVEQQWRPILIISGIHDYDAETTAENVQQHMTWNADNPFSIFSSLSYARENARIIREVISAEMWERMNYYHLWMRSTQARQLYDNNRGEFYSQIRRINQLIHGIGDATMSHGESWQFFRLGMFLERISHTARILDVKYHILLPSIEDVGSPVDHAHWFAILMSCSGYEPFHKKPRGRFAPADAGAAVAGFLIFDDKFPRSVRRCFEKVQLSAAAISGASLDNPINEADRKIAEMVNWLETRTIRDLVRDGLHESLTVVVDNVNAIGTSIQRTYFDVSQQIPESMSKPRPTQSQSQSQSL